MNILGSQSSGGGRVAPSAPTIGTATDVGTGRAYNDGAATVTFTPAANQKYPATSYTVTSSPGGFTASGASSPLTVTGLASATAYTFTVTATNAYGTSSASSATGSITATTVPQAPTIGAATSSSSATASVTFTANATGGKAVSTYTATSSPGSITGSNSASPISVTGLTNGTAYTFTVTATNANGTSAASAASNSVTPASIYWWDWVNLPWFYDVSYDGSFNPVIVGRSSTPKQSYRITTNTSGTITSQYDFPNTYAYTFAINDGTSEQVSNKTLFVGQLRLGGAGTDYAPCWYVASSTGVISGMKYMNDVVGGGSQCNAWRCQSNNGIWAVAGTWSAGSGTFPWIAQLDSAGNIMSAVSIQGNTGTARCAGITTAGNSAYGGYWIGYGGLFYMDSAGTYQWQRAISWEGSTTNGDTIHGLAFSTQGIFCAMRTNSTSNGGITIYKFNGAGTLQWQRKLTGFPGTSQLYCTDMTIQNSGNLYVLIQDYGNPYQSWLVCYDASGVIQWQRNFYGGATNTYAILNFLSDNGTDLYIAGAGSPVNTQYQTSSLIRYPYDGSVTGTYTIGGSSIVISASSLTDSTASSNIYTAYVGTASARNTTTTYTGVTSTAATYSLTKVGL